MYITNTEYAEITNRAEVEATTQRIKYACMLLDSRIGYYERNDDGWKLDTDDLKDYELDAVKQWIAFMITYLFENNDTAPSTASLTLGRFSITQNGQQEQVLPEQLRLADIILISSGLIKRGVDTV
jgi:hypothetical protein